MTRRPKLLSPREIAARIRSIPERAIDQYRTEETIGPGVVRVSFFPPDGAPRRAVRVSYESRAIHIVTRCEVDRRNVDYLARPPRQGGTLAQVVAEYLSHGPRDLIYLVRSSIDWMLEPTDRAQPQPPEQFP